MNIHSQLIIKSLEKGAGSLHGHQHFRTWKRGLNPMVQIITALAMQADVYRTRHDGSKLGDDQLLGPLWADVLRNVQSMLDKDDTAGLECGTIDQLITDMLKEEGFEP